MTDTATLTTPSAHDCFAAAANELKSGNVEVAREWRQLGESLCSRDYMSLDKPGS